MQEMEFYSQFINNPTALAEGYSIIKQYLLENSENRRTTLTNLLNPNIPVITLVGNVYPCQVFPQIPVQQQQQSRLILSELLYNTIKTCGINHKNCKNIMSLIEKIHRNEGYNKWIELYTKIIQNLPTSTLISFFIMVLRSSDDRIHPLSSKIYEFVLQNSNNPEIKPYMNIQQTLQILYYCIKSFVHLQGTEEQEDGDGWRILGGKAMGQSVIDFAWNSMKYSAISMKFSLKLLTVLYGGLSMPINQQLATSMMQSICQVINNFLSVVNNSNNFNPINLDEVDEDEEQNLGILMGIIVHQFLELIQTLIQNSEQFSQSISIELCTVICLLSATAYSNQIEFWIKNTDQYLLSIEDESQKTLRNRSNDFLNNLIDTYSPHHKRVRNCLKKIFNNVVQLAISSNNNKLQVFSSFIASNIQRQFNLNYLGSFQRVEEAVYFLMLSCCSQLYQKVEKKELMRKLGGRIMSSQNPLITILCIQICVTEINTSEAANTIPFLIQIAKKNSNIIGIVLAVGRGIAKCAITNKISISEDIFESILAPLIFYLQNHNSGQQLETATYIPLQLILKLIESAPSNKSILANTLSADFQLCLVQKYFHDGMVNTIITQILYKLQNPDIIKLILNKLSSGQFNNEMIGGLVSKWINSKIINFNSSEITILLKYYRQGRRSVIRNIVSAWLNQNVSDPNFRKNIDDNFICAINEKPETCWLVYMLNGDILVNGENLLITTVKQATDETSFPSQFENKLTLPFFIGLNHPEKLIALLSSITLQNSNLYEKFMTKFLQYAEYFKGDHLKIIASLFIIKLCEFDKRLVKKSVALIEGYGKLEVDEWEDEEQGFMDEEAIMQKMLGSAIANEQMERQLQQVFKQVSWASNLVEQKLVWLKSMRN